jgi:NAD(P)H-flavin reductase
MGAYRVLRVADPLGAPPDPGQFAMIAAAQRWGGGADERPYLPRAFSVARWRDGEAHFLIEDVGPGSARLCELRRGDDLWVLGPLGRGFAAPTDKRRALLVGGGAGIAPLAILQDHLHAAATPIAVLLGFRDAHHAHGAALVSDASVATQDGSSGRRGLVTDLLVEALDHDSHAQVYACGPAGMLEAVRAICEKRSIPAQLALESGMACGFGACYGCAVPTRSGGYLRLCIDGPVLDAAILESVDIHAGAPA